MSWNTLYDISLLGNDEFAPWLGLGAAIQVVAIVLYVHAHHRGRKSRTPWVVAIVGVLLGALGYGINSWDRNRLVTHLRNGEVLTVEGPIHGHQRWRQQRARARGETTYRYDDWETIYVGGVQFSWLYGAQEPAFTNSTEPPITFTDGMMLRVTYVEDVSRESHQRRIVRLETSAHSQEELARPANAPFPSSVDPVTLQPR